MPSPCAPPQGARFHGIDGIAHYEFEWDFSALQPKTNDNGTSGFARVISRSSGGGGLIVGYLGRVHRCASNPCRAVYPRSKYGYLPAPLHIQPSDWKPPAGADAEAADDSSGDSSDSSGDSSSSSGDSSSSNDDHEAAPKEPVSPLTPPKESTAAVAAEAAAVAVPSELLEPPPPPDAPKGEPRATRFAWSASKGTAAADVCGRASRDRSTATSPGRRCSSRSCGARTCRSLCRR